MNTKSRHIEVLSRMDALHEVERFVELICDEYSIYNSYYSNILVSLTEAFENAVQHGNQNDPLKTIQIRFENHAEGLLFSVEDEGTGYNPEKIGDPTDAENNAEAGNGLFLMRMLSDEITFDNEGSKVSLLFKISSINKELSEHRAQELRAYLKTEVKQDLQN